MEKTLNFKKEKLKKILAKLKKLYPDHETALTYDNIFQLLISVILSAQTTDEQVNKATPGLFKKYPTPEKLAKAPLDKIEKEIQTIGLYKTKAKNIKKCSQQILEDFDGKIPKTISEIITLAGAGRKTANVVLTHGYGIIEGICVDTHVGRLAQRIGLTSKNDKDAIGIEKDLMDLTTKRNWAWVTHTLINHGRKICKARSPLCEDCIIRKNCDYGIGST